MAIRTYQSIITSSVNGLNPPIKRHRVAEATEVPINRWMDKEGIQWNITHPEKWMKSWGNSLAVQWLGLCALTAKGPGSIPSRGTKIPQAAWCGGKKKTTQWNLAICDNMDGPRGYYAKWNKSDRERQNTIWFHLCVESKNKTNEQT